MTTAVEVRRVRCRCPHCACDQRVLPVVLYGDCPKCGTWRKMRADGFMGAHGACESFSYDSTRRRWIRPRPAHVVAICLGCREEAHR